VDLDARREGFAAVGRFGGDVDHLAADVDLPSVEDAGQGAIAVARQYQRHAAMRAAFVEETDAAVMGAESDEILAENADALGIAASFQPRRRHHRHPE